MITVVPVRHGLALVVRLEHRKQITADAEVGWAQEALRIRRILRPSNLLWRARGGHQCRSGFRDPDLGGGAYPHPPVERAFGGWAPAVCWGGGGARDVRANT